MIYSIYIILNIVNNKRYIGYTSSPNTRWRSHKNTSRYKNSNNFQIIHKALSKYGFDNFTFEVIYQSKCKEDIFEKEAYFINEFNSTINGYNICKGGRHSNWTGQKHSNKTLEGFRKDRTGVGNSFYGKKHSNATKELVSIANKGKRTGEDNSNISSRKKYQITFKDGTTIIIVGLKKFCREHNYHLGRLLKLQRNETNIHKDIIKIIKV